MKVSFNKTKKTLKIEANDDCFGTPFQSHAVAEILTQVYKILEPNSNAEFEYYRNGEEWGFKPLNKAKDAKNG